MILYLKDNIESEKSLLYVKSEEMRGLWEGLDF